MMKTNYLVIDTGVQRNNAGFDVTDMFLPPFRFRAERENDQFGFVQRTFMPAS